MIERATVTSEIEKGWLLLAVAPFAYRSTPVLINFAAFST